MSNIILFNKPFQVLSQFTDNDETVKTQRATLADFLSAPGFKAAGRLDYDSEGLLLLTDDGRLQQRIANPKHKQWKTYWVQIEGEITDEALKALRDGLKLKDGWTKPAKAARMTPPDIWARNPPIRFRANVPDQWISLSIQEGKNRQVRRMTAAVGFPTLRLIRASIDKWHLDDLAPGEHKRISV